MTKPTTGQLQVGVAVVIAVMILGLFVFRFFEQPEPEARYIPTYTATDANEIPGAEPLPQGYMEAAEQPKTEQATPLQPPAE